MRRVSLTLCAAAVATLAGCGGYDTVTPAGTYSPPGTVVTPAPVVTTPAPAVTVAPSATVVQPGAAVVAPGTAVVYPPAAGVRAGAGRVESNQRISRAGGQDRPTRRVGVRMDDGTVQFVDTEAQGIEIGDRVELTADNHIRYGLPPFTR